MFETLSDRLTQVFSNLRGQGRLSDADIDATAREIRIALLEADVALPVVREFVARDQGARVGGEVSGALNPAQQVIKIVDEELDRDPRRRDPPAPLRQDPADRDHAGGPAGLRQDHAGGQAGAVAARTRATRRCWSRPTCSGPTRCSSCRSSASGPASRSTRPSPATASATRSGWRASRIDEARRRQHDVVIVDTAGRLGIDDELMRQAADIRDAADPDEILFVVDAMIGQDAVVTAQAFLDGVGFDGVVLTKLDGDARGGAALSIAQLTGRPVMFASTGEKLEDFDVFHPERMASRILGMGDMLTLIEQAEKAFDEDQAAKMAGKLASGDGFTLEDFLEQMAMVRKLGPIGNLLGMLPGAAQNREMLSQIDDKDLDRAAAIIQSMTPAERRNPKILNGSRRARIASGSGVTVGEVNSLVDRFLEGRKMMRQMMGGGGIPGMPAIPGMRRASAKSAKARRARRSPRAAVPAGIRPRAKGRCQAGPAKPGAAPPAAGRHAGSGAAGPAIPPGGAVPGGLPGSPGGTGRQPGGADR